MLYDIYCDESRQDLMVEKTSINQHNRFICIGGIMIPAEKREELKDGLKCLKHKHGVFGELKWGNVSPNKVDFYLELVDFFFDSDAAVESRIVVIDANDIDHAAFNEDDHELGYYKFYYQLLHHWISAGDQYYVFTDFKTNKDKYRLHRLRQILNRSLRVDGVQLIQAIDSKESLLLQMQNVLMGAVGYKFNYGDKGTSQAKQAVVARIEKHLGHQIGPTTKGYRKFNVFMMVLRKGSR